MDKGSSSCDVVVIGAGISGLCGAKRLLDQGLDVVILDSGAKAGGMVKSEIQHGFLLEYGPSSIAVKPEIRQLVSELGLEREFLEAPLKNHPRFIYYKGALRQFPTGVLGFLTTPLLGWGSRLRVLSDPFRRRGPSVEVSAAQFFRDRFGKEVVENFVSPFISGIYAGDADQLSFQAAFPLIARFAGEKGSLLRGALAHFKRLKQEAAGKPRRPSALGSFRLGLGQLTEALSKSLWSRMRLGHEVRAVERGRKGFLISALDGKGQSRTWAARAVMVAQPAFRAAETLKTASPEGSKLLGEFHYTPLTVAHLGVPRKSLKTGPEGFGFLVPRGQGLRALGCLWTSSVFPGRAPLDQVLLTVFYGGAKDHEAGTLEDADLKRLLEKDLELAMGWDGASTLLRVTHLERALPAYNLGHLDRVEKLRRILNLPDLPISLVGNYLEGISVPDCIRQAWASADAMSLRLKARS